MSEELKPEMKEKKTNSAVTIGLIVALAIALLVGGFAIGTMWGRGIASFGDDRIDECPYAETGMMGGRGGWTGGRTGWDGQDDGGRGMMGCGTYRDGGNPYAPPAAPGSQTGAILSMEDVESLVADFLTSYGDENLEVAEIMQFEQNFYVQIREKDSGINAFEMLMDPVSGQLYPEPGPNMMWNTRYGMMAGRGGMMGGRGGMMGGYPSVDPEGEMRATPEEALALAEAYLTESQSGMQAPDEIDIFYGYYTIETLENGEIAGMVSVNGYTGDVWYHSWHGAFITMMEEAGE